MSESITAFVLTLHAVKELKLRGIDESVVMQVLAAPEQREGVRSGRDVLQYRIMIDGVLYLVRVFVDVDRSPAEVVTVYRTSKLDKYWRVST